MTMLLNFERRRPVMFNSVAQTVERADARIATPGKNQFPRAAGADELVVNDVGRHADEGEILAALTNDLMTGGERNEMRKTLHRDGIAVMKVSADGVLERSDFSHIVEDAVRKRLSCARIQKGLEQRGSAIPKNLHADTDQQKRRETKNHIHAGTAENGGEAVRESIA